MERKRIRLITQTALMAAIIFVFTAWLHVPTFNGYTHIGDAFLFLAASLLPPVYAAAAGAIGAGLADLLSGYAMWTPATIVIKSVTALCFTAKSETILVKRNYTALLPAYFFCACGYYLYECLITGNMIAPLSGVIGYTIQILLSSIVYVLLGHAMDRMNLKQRLVTDRKKG